MYPIQHQTFFVGLNPLTNLLFRSVQKSNYSKGAFVYLDFVLGSFKRSLTLKSLN